MDQAYWPTRKVAARLGVTERTVHNLVARLGLVRYRNAAEGGRRRYLRHEDVERLARLRRDGEFVPEVRADRDRGQEGPHSDDPAD